MKSPNPERDEALRRHFLALGCADERAYRLWCEREGLRAHTHKSAHEFAAEVRRHQTRLADDALKAARALQRRPEDVFQALVERRASPELLRRPELALLDRRLRTGGAVPRKPLLRLLTCVHERSALLRSGHGVYPVAVVELARLHYRWARTPESWKPDRHGADRQFASLARHLLATWDVPGFLDDAFFTSDAARGDAERLIWLHVADGRNLRKAPGLPVALTKRAAHLAHTSVPDGLDVFAGLRWAQARALGLSERAARSLVATALGAPQPDEPFWESVVHWFAQQPLLDPAHYGPLVDYLRHERTEPRTPRDAHRLPEGFTMAGRTPGALLARMEAWHRRLAKETRARSESWPASAFGALTAREGDGGGETVWRIVEVTTARGLTAEGRAMSHCVATYAPSCARGAVSVWSLTRQGPLDLEPVRVMTIAVNRQGQIVEARGRRNALPSASPTGVRLGPDDAALLVRGRRFVQRWAAAEGLTLPPYLV